MGLFSASFAACSKGIKKVPPIDCSKVKPKKSKDGFYRARSGGGPLPPCALDRIGKEEIRFGERVTSVEFSPNGRIIAGGFKDGMARLWDLKTGREIQRLGPHVGAIHQVGFLPDGKRFVTTTMDVHIWDLKTGKELKKWSAHDAPSTGLAISPDGKRAVTAGWHGDLALWNLDTGKLIRRMKAHKKAVKDVVYSADGEWIVSGSRDRTVSEFGTVRPGDR